MRGYEPSRVSFPMSSPSAAPVSPRTPPGTPPPRTPDYADYARSPPPPRRGPSDLARLPRVFYKPDAETLRALQEWRVIDDEYWKDWSLPVGWSIKCLRNTTDPYDCSGILDFMVSDSRGVDRFSVSESWNPVSVKSSVTLVYPPKFVFELERAVFSTEELVTMLVLPSIDDVNTKLRQPIQNEYFDDHEAYCEMDKKEFEGQPTYVRVTRRALER